jgi:hypothetical protein
MKVPRCQDDEFGHHFRQRREMIKVMNQTGRQRRGKSSPGIITLSSVIHIDIDIKRAQILILIFHTTGKLTKQGEKSCVLHQ